MNIAGICCWTAWRHTLRWTRRKRKNWGALLRTERYQGAQAMAMTTFERGVQAGLQQGQRTMLRKVLEARFGPLNPSAQQRFESLSPEQLEDLVLSLLKARSLQELGLED
jgi:hypothetical protein